MSKLNKAFTMIEAVMAITVIGILAAIAIPRLRTDTTQEAANQILSDIRYTQHMALVDDVTNPNNLNWQRAFWSINFGRCASGSGWYYLVGSDKDYSNGINSIIESALDPLTGKPMFWIGTKNCSKGGDGTVSEKIFITHKFGISNVTFAGSCNGAQHIGFDRLGRLHQSFTTSTTPNYASVLRTPCVITFTHPNGNFSINIEPETGYASIIGQGNQ